MRRQVCELNCTSCSYLIVWRAHPIAKTYYFLDRLLALSFPRSRNRHYTDQLIAASERLMTVISEVFSFCFILLGRDSILDF